MRIDLEGLNSFDLIITTSANDSELSPVAVRQKACAALDVRSEISAIPKRFDILILLSILTSLIEGLAILAKYILSLCEHLSQAQGSEMHGVGRLVAYSRRRRGLRCMVWADLWHTVGGAGV